MLRPTEWVVFPPLTFTTTAYLMDHGVSDPVAAIIGVVVGLGPFAVSACVDLLTDR